MALAPSWDTVASPGLRAPELTLPRRSWTPSIPVYPAGRHRGARRPWVLALLSALVPTRSYTGRHLATSVSAAYNGRHRS